MTWGHGSAAQHERGDKGVDSTVSAIVADVLTTSPIAGLSVAIGRGDRIVLAEGFGHSDLESRAPLTPDAVMDIGSVGKQFTAAAVLKLVEAKRIDLDGPMTRYLPNWRDGGRGITVRQLLNHTAGLGEPAFSESDPEPRFLEPVSPEGLLAFLNTAPFPFSPQETWRYSNAGYQLLGLLLERVHGKSYAQVIDEAIARPLGLKTLRYCDKRQKIRHRVQDYIVRDGKAEPIPAIDVSWFGGAGSVCATASDLVRWEHALSAGRALSPASLAVMNARPIVRSGGSMLQVDYGLGRAFGVFGGRRKSGHTGSGAGITAMLARYPDDDLTIAVLINTAGPGVPDAPALEARIASELLGRSPSDERPDVPLDPERGRAWSGTYQGSFGLTAVRFSSCEDRGLCAGLAAGPARRLRHFGGGVFAGPLGPGSELRFVPADRRAVWVVHMLHGLLNNVLLRVDPPQ